MIDERSKTVKNGKEDEFKISPNSPCQGRHIALTFRMYFPMKPLQSQDSHVDSNKNPFLHHSKIISIQLRSNLL